MAERWTDDRMDDLKRQVEGLDRRMEQGFREVRKEIGGLRSGMEGQISGLRGGVDKRFDGLRGEVNERFDGLRGEVNERFDGLRGEVNERFDRLDARFDTMVYALIGFGGAMFVAMASLVAAVILTL